LKTPTYLTQKMIIIFFSHIPK